MISNNNSILNQAMKYIGRKIKQSTYRKYLKYMVNKKYKVLDQLTRKEKAIYKMVKAALSDDNNKLTIAPISGTKYINMPDEEMFIILGDRKVIATNHKFYYDFDVSIILSDYLVERFNRILENECRQMEKEMTCNIEAGLLEIANRINKKILENGNTIC